MALIVLVASGDVYYFPTCAVFPDLSRYSLCLSRFEFPFVQMKYKLYIGLRENSTLYLLYLNQSPGGTA